MAVLTRQQLIDLIDQYIYANGQQRITAVQLREILIDIASSFAMEGGGSASGIDAVLGVGSSVIDGRQITNSFGGKVQLAVAPLTSGSGGKVSGVAPDPLKYLGINVAQLGAIGQTYNSKSKTVIGNIKSATLTRTLYDIPLPVTGEDFYTGTIYSLDKDPITDGKLRLGEGATTICLNSEYATANSVSVGRVNLHVQELAEEASSDVNLSSFEVRTVVTGPQTTVHVQNPRGFTWSAVNQEVATLGNTGLYLTQGKKLGLASGGANPTSGVVTLSSGTAAVSTAAAGLNSVISLTVQEGGAYTGNIRISAKSPSGFTISSTVNTDTCKVFWQIIDI